MKIMQTKTHTKYKKIGSVHIYKMEVLFDITQKESVFSRESRIRDKPLEQFVVL